MAEPTLAQLFGANSTQDSTDVVIKKSDLVAVGLTVSPANRAESILAALLKLWKLQLTSANQGLNDEQNITVVPNTVPGFTFRNDTVYRQDTFTITLDKAQETIEIDPDNY